MGEEKGCGHQIYCPYSAEDHRIISLHSFYKFVKKHIRRKSERATSSFMFGASEGPGAGEVVVVVLGDRCPRYPRQRVQHKSSFCVAVEAFYRSPLGNLFRLPCRFPSLCQTGNGRCKHYTNLELSVKSWAGTSMID